ncbi:MAG: metal-dependent hydrolase [Parvibaculum sp.]|jgi:hypothetical protein|nr:metal-dependent hydrolase [Parvibaculum sp.]|tara:strand:+ start:1783 stop:2535 length:753 start_codon:yes stop_codon:yes gene_type:complete
MKKMSRALHMDTLSLRGEQVPLVVRHNPRARRFIVRVDMTTGAIHVTTPNKRNVKAAISFAHSHADWLIEQRQHVALAEPFCDGALVPVRGIPHLIRHVESQRCAVHCVPQSDTGMPELHVGGDVSFLPRRVTDWLKQQAKADLNQSVLTHAGELNVRPSRITVRDQTSRWGSCSSTRALSFSWRLIFAPTEVLDYVAAHEVAHLVHMNHGPQFWRTVERLVPAYSQAVRWLETEGPALHKYGVAPLSLG